MMMPSSVTVSSVVVVVVVASVAVRGSGPSDASNVPKS